jgi:hypothetical protein
MNMISRMAHGAAERRRVADRRKGDRHDARGAAVSIDHGAGISRALCADVSRQGARLSFDRPMAVGEAITIGFGPDVTLSGRVTWVEATANGADCGIAFDEVVGGVGHGAVAAIRSDRRRMAMSALIAGSGFREGLNVTVVLPDGDRKAVLRWTDSQGATVSIQP